MKSFGIRTKIYFGDNALERLQQLPYRKVMIVADPFVVESGMINQIIRRLERAAIHYTIFKEVVPDPPVEKIASGVKAVMEAQPEALIAIGGGSAIDSCKGIREFAVKMDALKEKIPMIAIPTTSGTGSEVTSFSVITDPVKHVKYPLVSEDLLPTEAILDVEMVRTVPPVTTADTGMDVLTHAIEAYVSTDYNEFSAALSEKAIQIIGTYLLRSYLDNNDTHARTKMHVASCLAGLAFNSSNLGLNHGMAHQLGAQFHIPHGRANAILLPHIVEYNSEITKNSKSRTEYDHTVRCYENIARTLGLANFNTITTVRALVNWIQFMMQEMDMPLTVSQTGRCTKEEYFAAIDAMADAALLDGCTATNPRRPTKQDVVDIYKAIW